MEVDIFSDTATGAYVPGSDLAYNASICYTANGKHIYVGIIPVPKNPLGINEVPATYSTSTSPAVPEINITEYLKSRAVELMKESNHQWLQFVNHNSFVQKEGPTYRRCYLPDMTPYLDPARYHLYSCVLEIHEELDGE